MTDVEALDHESRRIAPWRVALKSFTSQWFLVPQGTGIIAVVLHQLYYRGEWLTRISQVFWVLTIALLVAFLLIYLSRCVLFWKDVAKALATDFQETACLSSISITFTTIIQMIALNLTTDWGRGWGMAAYVLWWINAAMAAVACIGTPYVFTKLEAQGVDMMPPALLLPLISALTAAAGGGVVCQYGELGADLEVPVIIVGFLFIGLALPMSVVVDAVFWVRLMDGKFPVKEKVFQLMILCGPLGQGGFALLILGNCVQRGAFAVYNTSSFIGASGGATIATASQFLGLLTWGYGIFWWAFACIAVLHYLIAAPRALLQMSKTLAAWSMVFPWGVYTNGAVELGTILHSRAFWVWSTVLTIILVVLWLVNAGATVIGVFSGTLLGLDGGWGAQYFDKKESPGNGSGQRNGHGQSSASESNGLRHRQ